MGFDLSVQDPSSNEVFPEETEVLRNSRKALLCCDPFAVSEANVRNVTPPVRNKNSPATFRTCENAETTHSDSPSDGLAGHQLHRKQNTSEGELLKFYKNDCAVSSTCYVDNNS